jgi:hypothetical protein
VRIVAPFIAFLISLPIAASAFKEGPYPNVTGGFGEQSCHLCHLDNPVNDRGGSIEVTGVPPTYIAGQTYPITIKVVREDLERGGFEIAARFASGRQKGRQAGMWKITDGRAQLIPGAVDKALTFVQHNLAGSRTRTIGTNSWNVEWIAPSLASAPVQFNVAANASNNDDSPLGDFIYLKSARSVPVRQALNAHPIPKSPTSRASHSR